MFKGVSGENPPTAEYFPLMKAKKCLKSAETRNHNRPPKITFIKRQGYANAAMLKRQREGGTVKR